MQNIKSEIKIPLNFESNTCLCIYGNKANTLKESDFALAADRGEAPWQLLEGCFYNYYFERDGKAFHDVKLAENIVVKNSLRKGVSEGSISPNIYVGSLELEVLDKEKNTLVDKIYVEVLPTKLNPFDERIEDSDYQSNYEFMLGEIAEKSTELLLQIESPVMQNFEVDFNSDARTIYQRFAFVKSLLNNDDFFESVQKIISSPTVKWTTESEMSDVLKVRRFSSKTTRQLSGGSNRINLSKQIGSLKSVPQKIESFRKVETYDTHENRFVKYALQSFLHFIKDCEVTFGKRHYEKSRKEAAALSSLLENQLHHSFFNDVARPTVLKLNSPALQRKSGYREVLNAWLKFDLSLRLIWKGGDDVYKAGKRDIAVLYEYWLFFKLYDLMVSKFKIKEIKHENSATKEIQTYGHLIDVTKDGLQLIVKSGTFTALECDYVNDGWQYHIRFSYNKTFSGKVTYKQGEEGSWTKPLRPDYTLSIWPKSLSDKQAELEEQIVHIHFDSKYKVQHFNFPETVEPEIDDADDMSKEPGKIDSLTAEKRNELKGIYKNADLMKMHAYKDAIRRTGGAYILYPGTIKQEPLKGFHEIIPGLGAFSVRPKPIDNGMDALSKFIDDVITNFKNSASQQKKFAAKTYETFKEGPSVVNDPMPYKVIPDETYVLVAYYRKDNIDWILKTGLFNTRAGSKRGSLKLGPKEAGAKYILLHSSGELQTSKLFKVRDTGPRIFSRKTLERINYPKDDKKSGQYYLVYKIEEVSHSEFANLKWDITKLSGYKNGRASALPFSVSLAELMKTKIS